LKVFADRGEILRLKCTKFYFGWAHTPPTTIPDHLAEFKRPYCYGEGWRRKEKGKEGGDGRGKGGEEM